eukprot:TRINITY_DN14172_c0_g1_i2.p1 TRINITY_DN14172_c0_g1~~TRINITY_DN14172_c0_g1_i2.p1  ORF type:complete len:216 (-),score=24.93 TRINITY_DN14172_c0_g1_i2:451-1098(-)
MKYLVIPEVQAADTKLQLINTGDSIIQGKLEAYSCKRAGADKKLSTMLDRQYSDPAESTAAMPCGSLERTYSGFTPILTASPSPRDQPDDFMLSESPGVMARSASSSSVGMIPDANMRRLFINLLLTMNTMFPDYDFSSVRPEEFVEENNHDLVVHSINSSLQKAMLLEPTLAPSLWQGIDSIRPQECFIFSYLPAASGGPLSERCMYVLSPEQS